MVVLKNWTRAINTISNVSNIFPENSTAFWFSNNAKNLNHIIQVIKFATRIGHSQFLFMFQHLNIQWVTEH